MDEPIRRDLAAALGRMKDHHGRSLAYGKIQKRMEAAIGIYAIETPQGVSLYCNPDSIPNDPSLVNVLAMVEVMGFTLDDLPPHVATAIRAELQGIRDLLARNAWTGAPA